VNQLEARDSFRGHFKRAANEFPGFACLVFPSAVPFPLTLPDLADASDYSEWVDWVNIEEWVVSARRQGTYVISLILAIKVFLGFGTEVTQINRRPTRNQLPKLMVSPGRVA
jgi:hypothetical protein